MPQPQVKVHGLARLARTLKAFGQGLDDLKDANQKAAQVVADEARSRAPKKSGALAGSIRAGRLQNRAQVRVGSAKVPYAGPIHWGWPARNIAENTFVTSAAAATENQWLAEYEQEIQRLADMVEGV